MKVFRSQALLALLAFFFSVSVGFAAEKVKWQRIPPEGIPGSLVIAGGGKLPSEVYDRFLGLAGGEKAHLVIIPTASARADTASEEELLAPWKDRKVASITLLHERDPKKADSEDFVKPLQMATGVWLNGGSQSRLTEAYLGTKVEKELYALLKRGGVIGGSSAGAAVMSKVMIASGKKEPKIAQGFDLLPGAIVDQHFSQRNRKERLELALKKHPGLFGVGIDEETALIVRGRRFYAVGNNAVSILLSASEDKEAKTIELKGRRRFGDLTAMRRSARDRAGAPFPPKKPQPPELRNGSLVIVGGGGMPREVVKKFVELAGGPEAPIVILPTAMPDPIPRRSYGKSMFERAGAKNVTVLPGRKLSEVEDPKNLAVLKKAKGIWFGGGRQWRFVDAYADTKAEPLLRNVLERGGVIGGSSAGASIQGEHMARGSPLENFSIMAEGYERGLGYLPGVSIDQHFAQRRRFRDMTSLVDTYPQLLGIGIDEATALIVQGHTAAIVGRGKVHFYDRNKPVKEGEPDYESVPSGGRYDLKARKRLPDK